MNGTVEPAGTIVIVALPPPTKVASLEVNATWNETGMVVAGFGMIGIVIAVGFGPYIPVGQVTSPEEVV